MDSRQGQIITFYSYKGGTGRSMALANVACILAGNKGGPEKKVLMMDWDLEAPGLHRYFANRLKPKSRAKDSRGTGHCDAEPGLIDLFYDLKEQIDILTSKPDTESIGEEQARKIFDETDIDRYIIPTNIEGLNLIKAGRFNPTDTNEYPERVNKFSWETLYNKAPQLMRVFAEVLAERYDFVLIDSRTGVTDISGVCTMLLPEKLVIVFTPNMQSLLGAIDVVRRATDYRKESDDLRGLMIFPLVSRVESNEPDLRYNWRFGNPERKITGYQREFEKVFREVYANEQIDLNVYFDEMQIQHIPRYAYGEDIAVLEERVEDKFSLKRSYKTFTNKLVEGGLPWSEIRIEGSAAEKEGMESVSSSNLVPFFWIAGVVTLLLIIATAVIFFSLGANRLAIPNANNTNEGLQTNENLANLPQAFERNYLGTLGGIPLKLTLIRDGNSLTGKATSNDKYFSTLAGTILDSGDFSVDETDGDSDRKTGTYVGKIDTDGPINGKWVSLSGNREEPFVVALQSDSTSTQSPVGIWVGDWSSPSGAYLTLTVQLDDAGEGSIAGRIEWTLRRTTRPDKISKVGKSATELVQGKYDQNSRVITLAGYRKDDPDNVLVMVDNYRLTFSSDGSTLNGKAKNGGPWNAIVKLTRDNSP